jgi:hypothetical protein
MKKILTLFAVIFVASCTSSAPRQAFPIYGNYCGDGNPRAHSRLDAIDTMDFLCQERLVCHKNNSNKKAVCDTLMADEARKIVPQDGQERALKRSMFSYFGSSLGD